MAEKMTIAQERTAKSRVYDAFWCLKDAEAPITRDALVRQTGLKTVTVDEALKALRRDEKIIIIERGLYDLAEKVELTQAVSVTLTPEGVVKIEKGDQVTEWTQREWRMIAPLAAGAAAQAAVIEHTNRTMHLADQVDRLKRQVAGLKEMLEADGRQGLLDLSGAST